MKDTSMERIEEVEIVDYLMTCYRNGIEPSKDMKVKAYEKGIDVLQLKRCMEEVYESEESGQMGYGWDDTEEE